MAVWFMFSHRHHTAYEWAQFEAQGKEKFICHLNRYGIYIRVEYSEWEWIIIYTFF